MDLQLSFILPCYNVERYIEDCLDSIYAQGMSEDEFEVICVNDCSTDNTCAVIERWLQTHSNLKLIQHERNMRVGIARNTGMRHAQGVYVCFVDADDLLPRGVMKKMYSMALENDVDIMLYNNVVFSKTGYREELVQYPDSGVTSGGDYVEKYLQGNIGKLGSPWAKLFKRRFLLDYSIWYSDLVYSEDAAFVWESMICAKRVKSVSETGYIYRANDFSFSANKKKPFVLLTSSFLYPVVLMDLLEKYGNRVTDVMRKGIVNEVKTDMGGFFRKYLSYEEEDRRKIYSMIRKDDALIRKLKGFMNRKQKLAYMSRKMGYGMFDAVVKKLYNN